MEENKTESASGNKLKLNSLVDQPNPIYGLVLLVAFLYSSVGFGGASGYIAIMAWFEIPINLAVSTALVLNLIVAGISFLSYYRGGFFRGKLLFPFAIISIPAAFIGATIRLEQTTYLILLHVILLLISLRMLLGKDNIIEIVEYKTPSITTMLIIGSMLGFLAGMIGIGGGIFLSPLIILSQWGSPKVASATAAGFIWMNSLSGLIGRVISKTFIINNFGLTLIPLGIIGSILGSRLGVNYFSGKVLKKILGIILLISVGRFLIDRLLLN